MKYLIFMKLSLLKSQKLITQSLKKKTIGVKFVSTDQNVDYLLSCEISDIFSNVEKKLYLKYPDLQNKNIFFLSSGNIIDRGASVEQNNIKHESVILIVENVENEEVPENLEDIFIQKKERIILLLFFFEGRQINLNIACNPSDKFEYVEEKLYLEHPELKNINLVFVSNGMIIDKKRTLAENQIKDDSRIVIFELSELYKDYED